MASTCSLVKLMPTFHYSLPRERPDEIYYLPIFSSFYFSLFVFFLFNEVNIGKYEYFFKYTVFDTFYFLACFVIDMIEVREPFVVERYWRAHLRKYTR